MLFLNSKPLRCITDHCYGSSSNHRWLQRTMAIHIILSKVWWITLANWRHPVGETWRATGFQQQQRGKHGAKSSPVIQEKSRRTQPQSWCTHNHNGHVVKSHPHCCINETVKKRKGCLFYGALHEYSENGPGSNLNLLVVILLETLMCALYM